MKSPLKSRLMTRIVQRSARPPSHWRSRSCYWFRFWPWGGARCGGIPRYIRVPLSHLQLQFRLSRLLIMLIYCTLYTHCTTGPLFPAAAIFPTTGAQKIITAPFTHYTYRYLLQQQRRDPGARVLVVSGDGGGIQRRTISSAETPRQLLPAFDRSPATNQIRQHGRRQPVPPRVHI